MSLTSFIKLPDVRRKFEDFFPFPKVVPNAELKAPPITKNYSLVGTAFDYLLRFYVKRQNPDAITAKWIAEHSLNLVSGSLKSKLNEMVSKAKLDYHAYLKDGVLSDDFLRSCISLAKIDVIYRSSWIPNFDSIDDGDVQDLRRLIGLVGESSFASKKACLLNPTFGEASALVGGADADIVVDNQLIDVKTTKFLKLKKTDFHQLIGYYVLSKLGGIDGCEKGLDVKTMSIYFSRHGIFLPLAVPSAESQHVSISDSRFREFVSWFVDRAIESRF